MKYLKSLLLIALVALTGAAKAQDPQAKAILDKISEKTRQYPSITSEFIYALDDNANDVHQSQEGTLKMKGNKYYIKLGDNQIYSDGETRWTFNNDMNEVYIDYADGGEESLDPTKIFTIWESGFKQYYDGEKTENGVTYQVIKLVPNQPADKSFHSVKVFVNKAKEEVGKIVIYGKQGENFTYAVKSFKTNVPYDNSTFVFNPDTHPGVDVIDNR